MQKKKLYQSRDKKIMQLKINIFLLSLLMVTRFVNFLRHSLDVRRVFKMNFAILVTLESLPDKFEAPEETQCCDYDFWPLQMCIENRDGHEFLQPLEPLEFFIVS